MRITRIYQDQDLQENLTLVLDEHASHHLLHVLRVKSGEELVLFNGQGGEYRAEVLNFSRKQVTVVVKEYTECQRESLLKIHLFQAISRGEKMDYAIQKAVELGVTDITPVVTERCALKTSHEFFAKRHAHWQRVIVSACEQSWRDKLPVLNPGIKLIDRLGSCDITSDYDLKVMLHPHNSENITKIADQKPKSIALLIGPEGGFSDLECNLSHTHGFHSVVFGPRILRTETAAAAGITILQYLYGDFGC